MFHSRDECNPGDPVEAGWIPGHPQIHILTAVHVSSTSSAVHWVETQLGPVLCSMFNSLYLYRTVDVH